MPVSSMQIQQMMMQQQQMFAGQMAYSQQIGAPMQAAMGMPAPAPWHMPAYAMQGAAAPYGERMAAGVASFGANVAAPTLMGAGALMGGMGMLGPAGHLFDPFGSALSGGMAGYARAGIGGAMGGAAMGALPGYLAMKAADVYGGAFMGGVRDQTGINQMMRSNFNFYGGQGAGGRGFSQGQLGQIGNVLQGTANRDLTTSLQELTQLTQMGAQSGQFNGVRDVQQFTAKFKQMLTSLKTIQTELGGTLTDAMAFTQNANRSGVFRNLDSYAGQMRTAQGATGMSQAQLTAMADQGAGLSQMIGGRRAQGARGALRTATSLGSAYGQGIINDEALQEATGVGGAEGIQALTSRLMEHTAQFSRRAMGRYSIFGLSNARGNGLDETAVAEMAGGNMTAGALSRRAHQTVGRLGRARAINREGDLRGALLEQGGLAGQIGIMRMSIGDRVMDQGDDYASLFMQRRMHMSRPEADIMTSLMRNQGAIAQSESETRTNTRRETAQRNDIQNNRSVEAFSARLSHSIEEGLGVSEVRDMGRRFVTKMSQVSERVMNHLLGVAESTMTSGDRSSLNRITSGRGRGSDIERMAQAFRYGGEGGGMPGAGAGYNPWARGMLESGESLGSSFRRRGVNVYDQRSTAAAFSAMQDARGGELHGADAAAFARMTAGANGAGGQAGMDTALLNLNRAMVGAAGTEGGLANTYRFAGGNANAVDALMARQGIRNQIAAPDEARMLGRRTGGAGGLIDSIAGGRVRFDAESLGLFSVSHTRQENAENFIASGGHRARSLEAALENTVDGGALGGGAGARRYGQRTVNGRTQDMYRNVSARQLEQERGELATQRGLKIENVRSVMQSEEWRRGMTDIQALGNDREAITHRLAQMSQTAAGMEGTQGETMRAMLSQAQHNVESTGRVGREMMVGGQADNRALQEMQTGFFNRSRFLERIGWGDAARGLRNASRAGIGGDEAGRQLEDSRAREAERTRNLVRLGASTRPEDQEAYRGQLNEMRNKLTDNGQHEMSADNREQYMSLVQGVSQQSGELRRLTGRSRGGRRAADEDALQLVTGSGVANMGLEGPGGRAITSNAAAMAQIRREMRTRGGNGSSATLENIITQSGATGTDATQMRELLTQTASSRGRGLDQGLAERLQTFGGNSASADANRRAALEHSQRARDPIGMQQIDLLRQINEGIRGIPGNTGDVSPAENTSHL